MIAAARNAATTDRERYVAADASALPFEDGAFELVALNNMIPFFDELARVTAPGGHVAVAYSRGPQTPIWVPLDRVQRELGRREFTHFATFSVGDGRQPPCPEAGSVVSFSAQGRSRRGSTGPGRLFSCGYTCRAASLSGDAAGRGSSVGRAHG